MNMSQSIGFWLSIVSAILAGALAWKLVSQGLAKTYRWLFAFLAFDVARTLLNGLLPAGGTRSALLYLVTEPVTWILYFLMTREIFLLVLRDHRGIATATKAFVRYAFVLAIVVSAALLWMDYSNDPRVNNVLLFAFIFGRVALVAIVVLLAAGVLFMSWFPVTISRNAATLLTGYAIYFGTKGLLLLARNIAGPPVTRLAGNTAIAVYAACLIAGLILLKKQTETARREYRTHADPAATERLMAQLEEINRKLEESTRR